MEKSNYLLKVRADLKNLSNIRSFINKTAVELEIHEDSADEICLAVDEACANIINHGYKGNNGDIIIEVTLENNKMIVSLNDNAPLYNPLEAPPTSNFNTPLSERPLGGMGVMLIQQNTDLLEYQNSSEGGNTLILTKYVNLKRKV